MKMHLNKNNLNLINMKTKIFNIILVTVLFTMGISSCSNHDFNPEDYVSSILSGEYGKGGYQLDVTENGEPIEFTGHVRFNTKDLDLNRGDFIFVDILPGESKKEFKDIPLIPTEEGFIFSMEYIKKNKTVVITGTLDYGLMIINISY